MISLYDRIVKDRENNREKTYTASTTELLLEQICESFGTELLPAEINDINGTKLVRESRPAIVKHPEGKKRILQVQYTRFSPLMENNDKIVEIYNGNRVRQKGKRKISNKSALREIWEQHEEWDAFEIVTNPRYIDNLNLHRWRKGLYFAVYDVENKERIAEKLKPFSVYEPIEFGKRLPQIHITLNIEPFFLIGIVQENTREVYDNLRIDFPQEEAEHRMRISSALSLHPLTNLKNPENAFKENYERFRKDYKIHSSVPRKLTMGLITAYLRKFCLDKDFY